MYIYIYIYIRYARLMFCKSVAAGHFVNRISRFPRMPKFSSNGFNLNIT